MRDQKVNAGPLQSDWLLLCLARRDDFLWCRLPGVPSGSGRSGAPFGPGRPRARREYRGRLQLATMPAHFHRTPLKVRLSPVVRFATIGL
jgi:hypothetical protein